MVIVEAAAFVGSIFVYKFIYNIEEYLLLDNDTYAYLLELVSAYYKTCCIIFCTSRTMLLMFCKASFISPRNLSTEIKFSSFGKWTRRSGVTYVLSKWQNCLIVAEVVQEIKLQQLMWRHQVFYSINYDVTAWAVWTFYFELNEIALQYFTPITDVHALISRNRVVFERKQNRAVYIMESQFSGEANVLFGNEFLCPCETYVEVSWGGYSSKTSLRKTMTYFVSKMYTIQIWR